MEGISEISHRRISTLYPRVKDLAIKVLNDVKSLTQRDINIAEAMRSMEHQQMLYAQGREFSQGKWVIKQKSQIVTNARPGLSYHCYGLAFDCSWHGLDPYLQNESAAQRLLLWANYGKIVKSNGMRWGGDFNLSNGALDLPHAECSYGLSISDCFELYERGGIKEVWDHIDLLLKGNHE